MKRIYLDNNASTPLDPFVAEAIIADMREGAIGNASSVHSYGREVRSRLTQARRQVADCLKVLPQEIVFTSSGTEALNMAITGLLSPFLASKTKGHIITSNIEHLAVYQTVKHFETLGFEVSYLPAGLWGAVTSQAVEQALQPTTRLIVLAAANNETGVKTDIEAVAAIASLAHVPFVVDGVALLGKETFAIPKGVSLFCFSGHKIHAPKGIGFAFVRSHVKMVPLLYGGYQEQGRRAGTENVSGIVGLAQAMSLLQKELPTATIVMQKLRDHFEHSLQHSLPAIVINGGGPRLCNTSNVSFLGINGETLLMQLDKEGIAASHGSACSSGALEPSRILLNMGISPAVARSTLRFSLSRLTTQEEIESCIAALVRIIRGFCKTCFEGQIR